MTTDRYNGRASRVRKVVSTTEKDIAEFIVRGGKIERIEPLKVDQDLHAGQGVRESMPIGLRVQMGAR